MKSDESVSKNPLLPEVPPDGASAPSGIDRRALMMRSAVVGAAAVIGGYTVPTEQELLAGPIGGRLGRPAVRVPAVTLC